MEHVYESVSKNHAAPDRFSAIVAIARDVADLSASERDLMARIVSVLIHGI